MELMVISPVYLTKYITIYPEKWDGNWKERQVMIHFKNGVVEDLIYNPPKSSALVDIGVLT